MALIDRGINAKILFFHRLYNGDANEKVLNQLINFIFESSTQRNFYFFHDFGPTDISSSLANCYNSWAEVTLFRCNEAINHLQRLIKSFNKLESIRNIVVICSSEYTRLLFREVTIRVWYLYDSVSNPVRYLYDSVSNPVWYKYDIV
ncbi:hypothetical protein SK128_013579 [Halocaridina rubra]|uniref:Uncharacterized protein n=1 Tax=Halocaridina rubra TaxID=373956 RepID=A0AAN9A3M4_HALRR